MFVSRHASRKEASGIVPRHGYGAAFRSSVFSRALGRRGSACRGADRSREYRVARAADEAVKRRPGRIVTLRQKRGCWRIAAVSDQLKFSPRVRFCSPAAY